MTAPTVRAPSRAERFRRLVTSPGVLWFGLPTAVVGAAWTQFRAEGYGWSSLATASFALRLAVSVYFVGFVGGRLFSAVLRAAGLGPDAARGRGDGRPLT